MQSATRSASLEVRCCCTSAWILCSDSPLGSLHGRQVRHWTGNSKCLQAILVLGHIAFLDCHPAHRPNVTNCIEAHRECIRRCGCTSVSLPIQLGWRICCFHNCLSCACGLCSKTFVVGMTAGNSGLWIMDSNPEQHLLAHSRV